MVWLEEFKRRLGRKGAYLYMDNLQVHKQADVRRAMEIANITPIFAPTYSPQLNPIETVFSWLKYKVKKMRLKDMLQNRQRDYYTLVPIAV